MKVKLSELIEAYRAIHKLREFHDRTHLLPPIEVRSENTPCYIGSTFVNPVAVLHDQVHEAFGDVFKQLGDAAISVQGSLFHWSPASLRYELLPIVEADHIEVEV